MLKQVLLCFLVVFLLTSGKAYAAPQNEIITLSGYYFPENNKKVNNLEILDLRNGRVLFSFNLPQKTLSGEIIFGQNSVGRYESADRKILITFVRRDDGRFVVEDKRNKADSLTGVYKLGAAENARYLLVSESMVAALLRCLPVENTGLI